MKLNTIMKILVVMLLAIFVTTFSAQTVFAAGDDIATTTDTTDTTQTTTSTKTVDPLTADFSKTFNNPDTSGAAQSAGKIIGAIINIAQVIGTGVAIIMLIVLAIQYISASPEGKAEIKKSAKVYIIGAIILFAASGILGIIRKFAVENVNKA